MLRPIPGWRVSVGSRVHDLHQKSVRIEDVGSTTVFLATGGRVHSGETAI